MTKDLEFSKILSAEGVCDLLSGRTCGGVSGATDWARAERGSNCVFRPSLRALALILGAMPFSNSTRCFTNDGAMVQGIERTTTDVDKKGDSKASIL